MRKLNKLLLTIILILVIVSACISNDDNEVLQSNNEVEQHDYEELLIHIDWPVYKSIDDLFRHATDVVRVVVLDDGIYKEVNISIPKPDNRNWKPIYFLYTLYRAQVTESYYGSLDEGDIIYVGQIGGKMGNRHYITNAMIPMMYADDLLLFLATHEEIEQANLLTPWFAVYRIESENGTRISSNTRASDDHKLVPVDERGRLSFTIGELRNYRAKEE